MTNRPRLLLLLVIVFSVVSRAVIVEEKTIEIGVTGNPHEDGNATSTGTCQGSPLCVTNLKTILQPKHILTSKMPTQTDTFKDIVMANVFSRRVPVYRFHQPRRMSVRELFFSLVLVTEIEEPHEIVQVSMKQALDSWFPGYCWSVLLVCDCGSRNYKHVGWKFTSSSLQGSHFFALIVDMHERADESVVQVSDILAPEWVLANLCNPTIPKAHRTKEQAGLP